MKLLALDTASELCSAALWLEGAVLVREAHAPRAHAELILPMIDALLREGGVGLGALDAIAFGRGPGAFTGVRLAAAIAQGLGFAAGRPLIGISDLRAVAVQALHQVPEAMGALVCQDARMEEVYWGCYERTPRERGIWGATERGSEGVSAAAHVQLPLAWAAAPGLVGAGSGFSAYPELSRRLQPQLIAVLPDLQPRAREVAWLAAREGLKAAVPPEQALPIYVRDQVTSNPPSGPRGSPPTGGSAPDSSN